MAKEARASFFGVDPSSWQTYREDLVGAIAHPLRGCIRRGALQPTLSELSCSSFDNQLIDRASRANTAYDFKSRASLSASRHIRAHRHRRTGARSVRPSALHCCTNVCIEFAGVPMEYVEPVDEKPEPISIARCRELLAEEAESMTDQEVALIRQHAETMACIVVEMYQEGCRIPE